MVMTRRQFVSALTAGSVLALAAGSSTPAFADDLSRAKAAGYLGERPDGYLGMVKPAPADVVATMKDINNKRRARYEEIAKARGTSRAAVEAIAGAKLVEQAPPGSYVMDASGGWVRK